MYQVFLKCKEYTDDSYWQKIFDDLAHDKPPRGVKLNDREIFCNIKGKEFNYVYVHKDPQIIFDELYVIFTQTLDIYSPHDRQVIYAQENSSSRIEAWNDTKKKSIKDSLILRFVSKMAKKYNLSDKEMRRLFFTINMSLTFKTIDANDIEMIDGDIDHIVDLIFSQGTFTLKREIPKGKRSYRSTRKMVEEVDDDE